MSGSSGTIPSTWICSLDLENCKTQTALKTHTEPTNQGLANFQGYVVVILKVLWAYEP